MFNWRWAFVLMGLPGLLLGAVIYFTVREPVRGRYAPAGTDMAQLPLGPHDHEPAHQPRGSWGWRWAGRCRS